MARDYGVKIIYEIHVGTRCNRIYATISYDVIPITSTPSGMCPYIPRGPRRQQGLEARISHMYDIGNAMQTGRDETGSINGMGF